MFGLEPALGAQAMTIKTAILTEIDDLALIEETARRDREFVVALRVYRAESGHGREFALRAVFAAMLKAENGVSHRRAGQAVSGFTRLCMDDATPEEKAAIRSFDVHELPLDRIGIIPGVADIFAGIDKGDVWPVLNRAIPGPELLRAFSDGMEKWYMARPDMYGIGGVITEENAKRFASRAIDGLLRGTESIAFEFISMKAENEPPPSPPPVAL